MGSVIVQVDSEPLGAFGIENTPLVVGSDPDCNIRLGCPSVSPRHLRMVAENSHIRVEDLGSSGGFLLNGSPVDGEAKFGNGDTLLVGSFELEYQHDLTGDDINLATEFSAPHREDDADFSPEDIPVPNHALLQVPGALLAILQNRIGIQLEFEKANELRKGMKEDPELPADVRGELDRQTRETQTYPPAEVCRNMASRFEQKMQKEAEDESLPQPSPKMVEARKMAFRQWGLLLKRAELTEQIFVEGTKSLETEVTYQIFRRHGLDPNPVYGFAAYASALETVRDMQRRNRIALKNKMDRIKSQFKGGLFGPSGPKEGTPEAEELAKLEAQDANAAALMKNIGRELSSLEKDMIKAFWDLYEQAAPLLLRSDFSTDEMASLRAFYRYGMISRADWMLSPEVSKYILDECAAGALTKLDLSMDANRVFFADEYIWFVARGGITPSPDEDLELNQRNTPPWKADRAWRRLISTYIQESALRSIVRTKQAQIEHLRARQAAMEEKKEHILPSDPDQKKKMSAAHNFIQECKVESGRQERTVEKIEEKYLAKLMEQREDSKVKLAELDCYPPPDEVARKEAVNVHRISRLTARLKDSFLPFTLRDNFKPESGVVNSRETILAALEDAEKRDPQVFKDILFPVQNKRHRTFVRQSPYIILAPGCGFMGFGWNPRGGFEVGRMVLPVYCPRSGELERLLWDQLADLRWNTTKAAAGMDLMTSDTFVAGYMTIRWDYRKRSKEAREKAGIFTDENDKSNWRRHYRLYMQSAFDAGKLLFFKNFEVYELIVKYMQLPEGIERLRK